MKIIEIIDIARVLPLYGIAVTGYLCFLATYTPFIAADKIHELATGRRL